MVGVVYMPSEYVDYEMTSQIFSPDQLTLAPFVAGTLREIILSLEFAKFPKSSRRKIEHLSFLIHLQIRFDNFPLIYKLHRDILEDINSGNAKWNDTDFFLKAEENILGVLNRHQPAPEDVSSMRDLEHLTEDNDISKEELAGEEAHPGEVQDLKDEDTPRQEDLQHLETEDMLDMDRVEEVLADLEDPDDIEDVESETEDIPRVYEECSICQERVEIVSKRSMSSHIKLKHSTKFYCPYCNASKCSGVLMLRHIEREHVGAAPRPVLCTTCGDVSTGFNQYLQHIKIHSVVTCQVCSKQFSDTARYKRHYAVCHAVGRDEVCPYCGKKYKHLKSHIYAAHTEREADQCTVCEFSSHIPGSVANHLRRVHSKPEVCQVCHKTVKDLKRHLRRKVCFVKEESERRKHNCTQCEKVFTQKFHLERHINSVHLKTRSHFCTQCSYKTTNNFNLNIHIKRIHERKELRTDCPFCCKQVYNIDFHIKAYHQEEMLSSVGLEVQDV